MGINVDKTLDKPIKISSGVSSIVSRKMSLFAFIMITSAALLSIRTFPTQGLLGWNSLYFNIMAIIIYLFPASMVAAELASGWPGEGGVYVWVKEAFGERWGFTAVWVQWFQMTIGFISVMAFIGSSLAYLVEPSFADNKLFLFVVMLVVWWGATYINTHGLGIYEKMTTIFTLLGVYLPFTLLIVGLVVYISSGEKTQIPLSPSSDLVPEFKSLGDLSLLVTYVFFFIGIEVTAAHVNDMENPKRNYPLAILIVSVVMTLISVLGALTLAWLVPAKEMSLSAGIMQAFSIAFGVQSPVAVKVIGGLIVIGAVGQVIAWVLGPVRGLSVTAEHGSLPPILQRKNAEGMPIGLLIAQGLFVTFWALVFLFFPGDLNSSFWALFALTTTVYIVMYFLMYAAAIRLRYTQPDRHRDFSIPGGKLGMWVLAGWGFLGMVLVFIVALAPPSQVKEDPAMFVIFMLVATAAVIAIPLIIYAFRRPSWYLGTRSSSSNSDQ